MGPKPSLFMDPFVSDHHLSLKDRYILHVNDYPQWIEKGIGREIEYEHVKRGKSDIHERM